MEQKVLRCFQHVNCKEHCKNRTLELEVKSKREDSFIWQEVARTACNINSLELQDAKVEQQVKKKKTKKKLIWCKFLNYI